MADPVTLAIIAGGLKVGGAAAETGAGLQANRANKQMIAYQARQDMQASQRRSDQIMAKQRTIGAAGGVDIAEGTPLLQQIDAAHQAEIERQNIKRKADYNLGLLTRQRGQTILSGFLNAAGGAASSAQVASGSAAPAQKYGPGY